MLDLLCLILFVWLFVKVLGLVFKVAWSLTKVLAVVLFVLSLPTLIGCLIVAGGLLLLVPIGFLGLALALLNA